LLNQTLDSENFSIIFQKNHCSYATNLKLHHDTMTSGL